MSADGWLLISCVGSIVAAPFVIYGAAYLGARRGKGK